MESIGTKTKKLPTTEQNYDCLLYTSMEERKDYAVLRFVDQNGWSYMVNDYAKGCSLMEYIKQGRCV